eukprot:CAMPEP_0172460760 /NCGR_PEP_ID=MMETSP1065-20121228/38174_1 /TAXON_ID=265537 /ORGANISM="Amphiprora paludosa, Strain CCMP125" /LENGTH=67 /DNA_ID=CAMNT_0013215893 /DNA_START=36 /DNA_END=236 /DNA_ORIENTATION=+
MTRSKANPPQPPPALRFSQTKAIGSQTAPVLQTESSIHGVVPNPSQEGLRRKKGKGTSNQKSREANK